MGELFATKWDCLPLITEQLIDYIRCDLAHIGGITEAKKIAAIAEWRGTGIAIRDRAAWASGAAAAADRCAFARRHGQRQDGTVSQAASGERQGGTVSQRSLNGRQAGKPCQAPSHARADR